MPLRLIDVNDKLLYSIALDQLKRQSKTVKNSPWEMDHAMYWEREMAIMIDIFKLGIIKVLRSGIKKSLALSNSPKKDNKASVFDESVHAETITAANDSAFKLVRNINNNTRQKLTDLFTRSINEGLSSNELAKQLESIFGKQRAKNIAITESTRAFAQGNEIAANALRIEGLIVREIWNTANDGLVCRICDPLNQQPRGEVWTDLPPTGSHIGCRCFITNEVFFPGDDIPAIAPPEEFLAEKPTNKPSGELLEKLQNNEYENHDIGQFNDFDAQELIDDNNGQLASAAQNDRWVMVKFDDLEDAKNFVEDVRNKNGEILEESKLTVIDDMLGELIENDGVFYDEDGNGYWVEAIPPDVMDASLGGVNISYNASVFDDGRVIIKPGNGNWLKGMESEVLAYEVSERLEYYIVPETVIREAGTYENFDGSQSLEGASVQSWYENASTGKEQSQTIFGWSKVDERGYSQMTLMDMLTANSDRHYGNFLIDNNTGGVIAIDNGYSFAPLDFDNDIDDYLKISLRKWRSNGILQFDGKDIDAIKRLLNDDAFKEVFLELMGGDLSADQRWDIFVERGEEIIDRKQELINGVAYHDI